MSGHGHVTPNDDGTKAHCGGPALCDECAREAGAKDAKDYRENWDPRPIHGWFGLSYASYLVLPRSVLQAMPADWQARLIELLGELNERFEGHLQGDYQVQLRDDAGRFVADPLGNYRYPPKLDHAATA